MTFKETCPCGGAIEIIDANVAEKRLLYGDWEWKHRHCMFLAQQKLQSHNKDDETPQ